MSPRVLSVVFLAVMGAAVAFFWAAAANRRHPRLHVRLALIGAAIDIVGTLAVFVTGRWLGWEIPPADAGLALVHRGFAYAATALLVVQATTGFLRLRAHPALGVLFLLVVTATYGLAIFAYRLGG